MSVTGVTVDQDHKATRTRAYRAGIIGAGFMGEVHARAVRVNGGEVVGVVASSEERSRQAADALLAARAFTSVDEMLASEDVDVVHVCKIGRASCRERGRLSVR